MSKHKSILCPQKKDHRFEKRLLFVGKEDLYVYCRQHAWIRVIFKKGNKKINFEDTAIVVESMGADFHFDPEPTPVLALGDFKLRRYFEKRESSKRDAKSN